MIVWVNGRLVDAAVPIATADDHGLTVGDGIFESLRVDGGRVFELERYLARLQRSAAAMRLDPPDVALVQRAIAEVVAADLPDPGRLRVTITSGRGPLGSARGTDGLLVSVIGTTLAAMPATAAVALASWPRNERSPLAGVKSTSYGENVLALAIARERGAGEAIFANTRGELCEGTGSNVFVGIGGRLFTPPLAAGCLAGVTREIVLELVDVTVEPLPIAALAEADEAFLTATTRQVQPIATVDGHALPSCPGPLTQAAMAAFAAYARPEA
jgi:branched-chain amino acid aminotransferase